MRLLKSKEPNGDAIFWLYADVGKVASVVQPTSAKTFRVIGPDGHKKGDVANLHAALDICHELATTTTYAEDPKDNAKLQAQNGRALRFIQDEIQAEFSNWREIEAQREELHQKNETDRMPRHWSLELVESVDTDEAKYEIWQQHKMAAFELLWDGQKVGAFQRREDAQAKAEELKAKGQQVRVAPRVKVPMAKPQPPKQAPRQHVSRKAGNR